MKWQSLSAIFTIKSKEIVLTTSDLLLQLLKKNPSRQFTQIELANIFKKDKSTIGYCVKRLKSLEFIIVKKHGRYKLIRWNDPLITPIPHAIELPKPTKPKIKAKKRIKNEDSKPKRGNMQIHVPKEVRDQLNWEKGKKVLFVEKDKKIYCKTDSE